MKVMFDINVVLDIVANRVPHYESSRAAYLKTIENGDEPYVAIHAVATLYYLLGGAATRRQRDAAMAWICDSFTIAGAGENEVQSARTLGLLDFEDALVVASALSSGCERIVTRNVADFKGAPIPVVAPVDF